MRRDVWAACSMQSDFREIPQRYTVCDSCVFRSSPHVAVSTAYNPHAAYDL